MGKPKIKLDHKGIEQVLKSAEVKAVVGATGESVAANTNATASGDPITTDAKTYTGKKRAVCVVMMKHPAALKVEAKRAPLTKAAKAAGLDVNKEVKE